MASDVTAGAARESANAPESLSLAGSVIRSRYRVNAVSSVDQDVVLYSAEDTRRGRSIALKVLRGEFARDAAFVAAVRAQSRTLARSAHVLRGVQRVYESGDTETGELFVALEWVEGARLCDVLDAGGELAAPTALRIAIRVGEALEALHHNGLVHGRLGPDSVVVVNDGERIRLVGAELAAAYRTPIGRRVRDPFPLSYPAPELAEGGEVTEATDVYALGMLLRQLLTAGKGDPTPPLSPAVQRIIATALEPRPERRYPDISVMVNDIWGAAAVVGERESRPRSVKTWGHPRRRVRRRRRPITLRRAAAVAAAAVTAAIVWVVAIDRIATRLYPVAPPAATALQSERGALPSAPRESAVPPESAMVEDKLPVERRAPLVPRPAPPPAPAPRMAAPAIAPSTIDGRPRPMTGSAAPVVSRTPIEPRPSTERPATVTSAAPVAPRAPVVPTGPPPGSEREGETSDGSAAIDWLLRDRR